MSIVNRKNKLELVFKMEECLMCPVTTVVRFIQEFVFSTKMEPLERAMGFVQTFYGQVGRLGLAARQVINGGCVELRSFR